jgi:hypothetical protein
MPSVSPLGPVEAAWLFTRGDESVRLVRVALAGQTCRLLVHGPGTAHYAEEFADPGSCAVQQSEIERRLVAAGYRLNAFRDDRRAADGTAPGASERRRR